MAVGVEATPNTDCPNRAVPKRGSDCAMVAALAPVANIMIRILIVFPYARNQPNRT
jgi:hypothetical protein